MSVEFHDDQATPGASEYSWCTPLDTDFTRTIVPAGNTPRLNHALDVLDKLLSAHQSSRRAWPRTNATALEPAKPHLKAIPIRFAQRKPTHLSCH